MTRKEKIKMAERNLTEEIKGLTRNIYQTILKKKKPVFCHGIGKSGVSQEITQCFLLFLFIGIVLIVSGVGLILEK